MVKLAKGKRFIKLVVLINNSFENLGHNRDNRHRSIIIRVTPTSYFLKKRCDSCILSFIGKNTNVSID